MIDRKTREAAGKAITEIQWLYQDYITGMPEHIITVRKTILNNIMSRLCAGATTKTDATKLEWMRIQLIRAESAKSIKDVLDQITKFFEGKVRKNDTERRDRQAHRPNEG